MKVNDAKVNDVFIEGIFAMNVSLNNKLNQDFNYSSIFRCVLSS